MKVAIVIPCHIKLTKEWIHALEKEAKNKADVIIVDDSNGKLGKLPNSWRVYGYNKQKEFLGKLYRGFDQMFHKCSACRVFGHLVAYKGKYDVIIGLDSDCVVSKGFIDGHLEYLERQGSGWENPLGHMDKVGYDSKGLYPRGFPYSKRNWKVVANMGLWDKTLDLNGADRYADEPKEVAPVKGMANAPIPFSGMNFAITREALPGFLFIPNFVYKKDRFRRIDDIWGGYIFQKLAHQLKHGITYGWPIVNHITEVDAKADAKEEEGMYIWEDNFLDSIDMMMFMVKLWYPKEKDYTMLYKHLLEFKTHLSPEFNNLIPIIEWWVEAWEKYGTF